MLAALTACMAAEIITVDEGVSGFSNEGVLTVVVSTRWFQIYVTPIIALHKKIGLTAIAIIFLAPNQGAFCGCFGDSNDRRS